MHSPLATPTATKAVLQQHGLFTKHRLGQNFLVNDAVIGKILDLAELGPEDVVLEVGPGIGTLTCALLPDCAEVVAIEMDPELPAVLEETCARDGEKLTLVRGDALKLVPRTFSNGEAPQPDKLVSNLPYQVAATLILKTFQELPSVGRAVVMVQREVADRIAAEPGTKAYGAYTAKLRLFAQVTGRFEVGPGNFFPPPRVDSAVVRLDRAMLVPEQDASAVCAVIDAAFAQRRKTIRNSMSARGYEKAQLDAAFEACGISPTCRAETLAPQQFVALARALASLEPALAASASPRRP